MVISIAPVGTPPGFITLTELLPMFILSLHPAIRLEWDRFGLFVRLGTRDLYARRKADEAPSWAWVRHDTGDLEVDAGRFRFTASRAPATVAEGAR